VEAAHTPGFLSFAPAAVSANKLPPGTRGAEVEAVHMPGFLSFAPAAVSA
jgi:hypothetical protein